jgi:hypothetical protein
MAIDVELALPRVKESNTLCEASRLIQEQMPSGYSSNPTWLQIDRDIANRMPSFQHGSHSGGFALWYSP